MSDRIIVGVNLDIVRLAVPGTTAMLSEILTDGVCLVIISEAVPGVTET